MSTISSLHAPLAPMSSSTVDGKKGRICFTATVMLVAILSPSCDAFTTKALITSGFGANRDYRVSTLAPPSFINQSIPPTSTQLFEDRSQQNPTNADDKNEEREQLKESLLSLAAETKRGFIATSDERSQLSGIITKLAEYNPTTEPANAYYDRTPKKYDGSTPTIAGKWTLVYTDAPDITGLDTTTARIPSLLPQNAKLGRIGQECIPEESLIKNVIEWKRPDWVQGVLDQVGNNDRNEGDESRILQKVCCEATASPIQPTIVELKLSGFELVGNKDGGDSYSSNGILASLQEYAVHGPAAWFERNPLNLSGPLKAPFGQFELLYLDRDLRIIRTGQGFFAVNVRQVEGGEWF